MSGLYQGDNMNSKKNFRKRKKYLIKKIFQFKFAAVIVFAILVSIALVAWDVYYTIGTLLM